jgi:hypothetical protein
MKRPTFDRLGSSKVVQFSGQLGSDLLVARLDSLSGSILLSQGRGITPSAVGEASVTEGIGDEGRFN